MTGVETEGAINNLQEQSKVLTSDYLKSKEELNCRIHALVAQCPHELRDKDSHYCKYCGKEIKPLYVRSAFSQPY